MFFNDVFLVDQLANFLHSNTLSVTSLYFRSNVAPMEIFRLSFLHLLSNVFKGFLFRKLFIVFLSTVCKSHLSAVTQFLWFFGRHNTI